MIHSHTVRIINSIFQVRNWDSEWLIDFLELPNWESKPGVSKNHDAPMGWPNEVNLEANADKG